ncbi:MAG: thiamine phosphate synthase [Acidobacteriota bacterium]
MTPRPPQLYGIADADALGLAAVPAAVEAMATAGVGWIQVRIKAAGEAERYRTVASCCRRLEGSDAALWMDDRVDLASMFPVAGVHVGQRDLPPDATRRVVGEGPWIGLSCHDERQVADAEADPAVDVVAIGPIFPTRSKERPDPVVGIEGLKRARRRTRKPLVAIGGIDQGRLTEVLEAGADSAVILGALCRGPVEQNARRLMAVVEAM